MVHLLAGVVAVILIGLFGRVILEVALKTLFLFGAIYMFAWLFLADHNPAHRIPSVSTPENPCWSQKYHRGQRFFTENGGTYPSPICND